VLNRVESTEYSGTSTCVHIHEYPLTLATVGIGQVSRLNALYLYKHAYSLQKRVCVVCILNE